MRFKVIPSPDIKPPPAPPNVKYSYYVAQIDLLGIFNIRGDGGVQYKGEGIIWRVYIGVTDLRQLL